MYISLIFLLPLLLQINCQDPTDYCPNNCNTSTGNGQCSSAFQQCICNEGFFDKDCGVQVPELQNGVSERVSLTPGSWGYFYISLDSIIFFPIIPPNIFAIKVSLAMQL